MSTRATVHFEHVETKRYDPDLDEMVELVTPEVYTAAIVYRHSDGYPEGLGKDLASFIREVRTLRDSRLNDASYLAAKWVVFDAHGYVQYMLDSNKTQEAAGQRPYYPDVSRLGFLSIGIVPADPGDIEYRYHVNCDGTVATITYDKVGWDTDATAGVIDIPVEEEG